MSEVVIIQLTKDELAQLIKDSIQPLMASQRDDFGGREPVDLLKVDDVCKMLKVSKVTVHQWKKAGKLPFYRISNRIFFKRMDVIGALEIFNSSQKRKIR